MLTNEDRVEDIGPSVEDFAKRMGLTDADGTVCIAGDMISNILHWACANAESEFDDPRIAAIDCLRAGFGHFLSESYIDYEADVVCELGPEATINISAICNGEHWSSTTGQDARIVGEFGHA